jgi:chromosomal replication initiator protein
MENFWQACSSQLEQELPPQQYSAWIKPLVPLDFEEGKLRIAAPNRFKLDWVKAQFANRISELANQYWDDEVEVQFVLDPRGGKKPAAPAPRSNGSDGDHSTANVEIVQEAVAAPEASPRRDLSRINVELTFDSFVTVKPINWHAPQRYRWRIIRAFPTTRCFCMAASDSVKRI